MFMVKAKSKTVVMNKVQEWCQRNNLDRQDFIGRCLTAKVSISGKTLVYDTIQRVWEGDTNINLTTAALIASSLGVSISDVFDTR